MNPLGTALILGYLSFAAPAGVVGTADLRTDRRIDQTQPARSVVGTAGWHNMLLPANDDAAPALNSQLVASTTSSVFTQDAVSGSSSRETSGMEIALGDLRSWLILGENWDREGAEVPSLGSIRLAAQFLISMPPDVTTPEPMLLPSGRAALVWDGGDHYADLEFTEDGRITYYIETIDGSKHKGVVPFAPPVLPTVFNTLLFS